MRLLPEEPRPKLFRVAIKSMAHGTADMHQRLEALNKALSGHTIPKGCLHGVPLGHVMRETNHELVRPGTVLPAMIGAYSIVEYYEIPGAADIVQSAIQALGFRFVEELELADAALQSFATLVRCTERLSQFFGPRPHAVN
jgi:hypothetical protein